MGGVQGVRHIPEEEFPLQCRIVTVEGPVPDAGPDVEGLHLSGEAGHVREVRVSLIPGTVEGETGAAQLLPAGIDHHKGTVGQSLCQSGQIAAVLQNAFFGDVAVGVVPVVAPVDGRGGQDRVRTEPGAEFPGGGPGGDPRADLADDLRDSEGASVQQYAASAGTDVAPEGDALRIGRPSGKTSGADLDTAGGDRAVRESGEEIPRHHPRRVEAAPGGISVGAFPAVTAEARACGDGSPPAQAQKTEGFRFCADL